MKKNDVILVSILLILAVASYSVMKYTNRDNGAQIEVLIDGEVSDTFNLDEDLKYKIIINDKDYNILAIKDGSASIVEASCPDQLCVKQKEISKAGESIICLPNKLVVRVINEGETTVDGVAD